MSAPARHAAARIGLGCARLGSTLGGASGREALDLIRHALEAGVGLLDTADIYGQGESERLIGEALRGRRERVVLVTKAGQRFTPAQRLARLAKAPLRHAARLLPVLRRNIARRRAAPLPRDFSPTHLIRSLEGSLHRLRVERVDLFLLHSPDAATVASGGPLPALADAMRAGKIGGWGVSCDDEATARAALALPSLAGLQLPLAVAQRMEPELNAASGRGVRVLVREVFAGATDAASRRAGLRAALALSRTTALIGTTSRRHLDEVLTYAEEGEAT